MGRATAVLEGLWGLATPDEQCHCDDDDDRDDGDYYYQKDGQ